MQVYSNIATSVFFDYLRAATKGEGLMEFLKAQTSIVSTPGLFLLCEKLSCSCFLEQARISEITEAE